MGHFRLPLLIIVILIIAVPDLKKTNAFADAIADAVAIAIAIAIAFAVAITAPDVKKLMPLP